MSNKYIRHELDRPGFPSMVWAHLEKPKSPAPAATSDSSLLSPISKSERKKKHITHKNDALFQIKGEKNVTIFFFN